MFILVKLLAKYVIIFYALGSAEKFGVWTGPEVFFIFFAKFELASLEYSMSNPGQAMCQERLSRKRS